MLLDRESQKSLHSAGCVIIDLLQDLLWFHRKSKRITASSIFYVLLIYSDDGCVKILDSPSLAQRCQQEFENEKLRFHDAYEVLDELVQEVCRILSRPATEVVPEEEESSQSTKQSTNSAVSTRKDSLSIESEASDFSQKSEILQLWWSTNTAHS